MCIYIRPLRCCLKCGIWIAPRSLSRSLSLCMCALQCVRQRLSAENGTRVPKHVQMINFHSLVNLSVNPRITCVPNRGDWSVRITDHLRSVAPLTKTVLECVIFLVNRLLTSYKPSYYNLVITHKEKIFACCTLTALYARTVLNP